MATDPSPTGKTRERVFNTRCMFTRGNSLVVSVPAQLDDEDFPYEDGQPVRPVLAEERDGSSVLKFEPVEEHDGPPQPATGPEVMPDGGE